MDLDENAIKKFTTLLNSPSPVLPDHLLSNLGVVHQEDSIQTLNNAGVLFFAKIQVILSPKAL